MHNDEYEVVWDGGELLPPAPQDLYEMQNPGKRTLTSLGLRRFREEGAAEDRDASVSTERQKVPAWRKRMRTQRKDARSALKRVGQQWSKDFDRFGINVKYSNRAKLTEETVRRIRRAYANGEGGFLILGRRFGLSGAAISQIVHRCTYRSVTD